MQKQHKPIGYWIRKADDELTASINRIQAAFHLSRTDWQVLNTIAQAGTMPANEVITLMKPFADAGSIMSVVKGFRDEEIVEQDEQAVLHLLPKGKELHRRCLEQQQVLRQSVMADISAQDYSTAVCVLQKIVANIEERNG